MSFNLMRYNVEKFISKTKYKIGKFFQDEKKSTTQENIRYTKDAPKPDLFTYHRKKRFRNTSHKRWMWGTLKPMKGWKQLNFRYAINHPFIAEPQDVNHSHVCPNCKGNRFKTIRKDYEWECRGCFNRIEYKTPKDFSLPRTIREIE